MTVSLLFGKKGAKIGSLQLDASLRDTHTFENEVSSFPVEDGSSISDHVRLLPVQLTIEGIVTDSPIDVRFSDVSYIVEGENNREEALVVEREDTAVRVETARDLLLSMRGSYGKEQQLLTVVTGLKVYENMVMTKLSFERDGKTGRALPFTASFVELTTQKISTESLRPAKSVSSKASPKSNKGKQKASDIAQDEKKVKVSSLKKIFNTLSGGS